MTQTANFTSGKATKSDWESILNIKLPLADQTLLLVEFSPALAKTILNHYNFKNQRPLDRDNVLSIRKSMQDGTYIANNLLGIVFEYDGGLKAASLINGQHTLTALVEANVTLTLPLQVTMVASPDETALLYAKTDMGKGRTHTVVNNALNGQCGVLNKSMQTTLKNATPWVMAKLKPNVYGLKSKDKLGRAIYFGKAQHIMAGFQQWYMDLKKANPAVFSDAKRQQVPALFLAIRESGSAKHQKALDRLLADILEYAKGNVNPKAGTALWAFIDAMAMTSQAKFRGERMYALIRAWEAYVSASKPSLGQAAFKPIMLSEPAL